MKDTRRSLWERIVDLIEPVHSVHQQVADLAFGPLDEDEYAKGYKSFEIGKADAEAEKGD